MVMSEGSKTAPGPAGRSGRGLLPGLVRQTLTCTLYLLIAWPFQLAVFMINITIISTAFSILLAPLAIPLSIAFAAGAAAVERRMVGAYVGLDAPPARRLARAPGESWTGYAVRVVKSPAVWLEVAWSLVAWVVSTFTWVLTIAW